jgi:hypothetical protein
MLRGLKDRILTSLVLAPQTLSAAVLSVASSMAGKRNFAYQVAVGSFAFTGVNYLTLTIMECDTVGGTYVADPDSAVLVLNDQATQESKVHIMEYKGTKAFTKLDIAEAGTVAAPISVVGLCTEPEKMPAQ